MMQAFQSSMTQAGIKWNLVSLTNNAIGAALAPCKVGSPCKWDLIDYEEGYYWAPGQYPDGGAAFGTGGAVHGGLFASTLNALIQKARTAPASQAKIAAFNYESYAEKVLPGRGSRTFTTRCRSSRTPSTA